MAKALGDRILGTGALTETMRRRRLRWPGRADLRDADRAGIAPRKVREASALWRQLLDASDITVRDGVWAHPDLIPDATDLDHPAAFADRVIGGARDDPIAELERTLAEERANEQREKGGKEQREKRGSSDTDGDA